MKKKKFYMIMLSAIMIVSGVFYENEVQVSAASRAEKCYSKLLKKGYYEHNGTKYSFLEQGVTYTMENVDGKGSVEMLVENHDTYNAGMYSLLFAYKNRKAKCVLAAYDIEIMGKKKYIRANSEIHAGCGNEWIYLYDNGKVREVASVVYEDGIATDCKIKGKKVSASKYEKYLSKIR